jgi:hypothetical protein
LPGCHYWQSLRNDLLRDLPAAEPRSICKAVQRTPPNNFALPLKRVSFAVCDASVSPRPTTWGESQRMYAEAATLDADSHRGHLAPNSYSRAGRPVGFEGQSGPLIH